MMTNERVAHDSSQLDAASKVKSSSLTSAAGLTDKPVHIDAVASLASDGAVTWTAYVYSHGSLDASATGSDRQAAVVDAVARYRAFRG